MVTAAAASAKDMPAGGWQAAFGIISTLAGIVLIVSPFTSITSIAALTLVVGVMAIVLGLTEVVRAIRMRAEVGRLAPPTARQRRPLFHSRPPEFGDLLGGFTAEDGDVQILSGGRVLGG
jgi:hypothetical protein